MAQRSHHTLWSRAARADHRDTPAPRRNRRSYQLLRCYGATVLRCYEILYSFDLLILRLLCVIQSYKASHTKYFEKKEKPFISFGIISTAVYTYVYIILIGNISESMRNTSEEVRKTWTPTELNFLIT